MKAAKIAYIGLGHIGAPCARLIARAGFDLAVFDPMPAALRAFDGLARLGQSAADAAAGVTIACVCVRDDGQVRDAVLGPDGLAGALAAGSLILIHSTVSIELLHELQALLLPKGIALADAPISRTRRTDDEKFVFTMLGGEPAEVARAMPVIEAFSTDIAHMGPLGAGMASKIANNLMTWVHITVGTQAFNFAAKNGVAFEKLRHVMTSNGNLTLSVEQVLDGKHKAGAGSDPARDAMQAMMAGLGEKDLALAIETGEHLGMDMGMADQARRAIRGAMTLPLVRPPADADS